MVVLLLNSENHWLVSICFADTDLDFGDRRMLEVSG